MDELRVPTRRITVEIHWLGGEPQRGTLYHAQAPWESGSPEDIGSELNDERSFVPFAAEDALAPDEVLSKRHIVRVRLDGVGADGLRPEEAVELGRTPPCTLLLADGSRVTGRLVVEAPISSSRIVDKLNQDHVFLPLVTAQGLEFVNRSHVVHVHLL